MPAPDRPAYLEAKRKSILTAAGIKCGRIFGTSIWDETLYKATLQPQIEVSILTALSLPIGLVTCCSRTRTQCEPTL